MTLEGFVTSLGSDAPPPPPALAAPLKALWWAGRDDWDAAHAIVQNEAGHDEAGRDAAWVHAYLHRREGDAGNAAYWYRRAGRAMAGGTSRAEWREIATALLRTSPDR